MVDMLPVQVLPEVDHLHMMVVKAVVEAVAMPEVDHHHMTMELGEEETPVIDHHHMMME